QFFPEIGSMRCLLVVAMYFVFPLLTQAAEPADKPAAADAQKKAEPKNLLQKTNEPESCVFEVSGDGQGDMQAEGQPIAFTTTATDGTDWHVQAYQTGLDLKDGKKYVLKFKCKAPKADSLTVVGQIHEEDWHEIGLHEQVGASDDFKSYEFEFTAD